MSRRSYAGNTPISALASPIGAADTALTLTVFSNFPSANFVLTLDAGSVSEEKVLVGARSSGACSGLVRGYDGTVGAAHSSGAVIKHTLSAVDLDEANAHVNAVADVHGVVGSLAGTKVDIAFHVPSALVAGLRIPKFVATRNMTLLYAQAQLDSGSGATYQIYINRASVTDIGTSGAVGITSVLNDFTDHNIVVGDVLQVYIASAGTSASDLSITVGAVYR